MSDQTLKNLKEAFAGESQANRRYLAFAQKADQDGFPNLARLFRAIAQSETIHALNHLRIMGGVGSTADNVKEAWQGEKDEFNDMYPMFMDQANRDGNSEALTTFSWAIEAEKIHADFYEKALAAAQKGEDFQVGDVYVCAKCGYTVEGSAPDRCPLCGEPKERFERID